MTRQLFLVLASILMLTSTTAAQTDFRETLQTAFPAAVTVRTPGADPGVDVRALGPLGGWRPGDLTAGSERAGFAVGVDLIATQILSDIDEVSITTADEKVLPGKVLVRDHVTGLAVVQVPGAKFVSLVVGAGIPAAGLPVVIVRLDEAGAPRAAMGMIASGPSAAAWQLGFVQHLSASLNRLDVGAPITDATGVVVGVVGRGPAGGLWCLPSGQLAALLDHAAADQPSNPRRGLVGVEFTGENDPLVSGVTAGTPAERAGLMIGDRIVRVGEFEITTTQALLAAVAMSRAGDELPIVVQRGEESLTLVVKLAVHPRQELAMSDRSPGQLAQRAWELRNGRLVPLGGGEAGRSFEDLLPKDLENLLKISPNGTGALRGVPQQPDGLKAEREQTEDALRELERERKNQADRLNEMQKKLRELQDRLQAS